MKFVVYGLSAVLVILGVGLIAYGAPIVHFEEGWTSVIAGATFAAAGVLSFGLGVLIDHFERLHRALAGLSLGGKPAMAAQAIGLTAVAGALDAIAPAPAAHETALQPRFAPEPVLTPEPAESRPEPVIEPLFAEEIPAATVMSEPPLATFEPDIRVSDPVDAPHLEARDLDEPPLSAPAVISPTAPLNDAPELPARRRSNFLSSFLARRSAGAAAVAPAPAPAVDVGSSIEPALMPLHGEVPPPPVRTSIDLSSGWDEQEEEIPHAAEAAPHSEHAQPAHEPEDAHEPEPHHEPEPAWAYEEPAEPVSYDAPHVEPEPPAAEMPVEDIAPTEPHPLRPTIVGRYNAGSASYVMYSNGMIEVETETGMHQFDSMQELKAFIEQQDSARV